MNLLKEHMDILERLTKIASEERQFNERGQFMNIQKMIREELGIIEKIKESEDYLISCLVKKLDDSTYDVPCNSLKIVEFDNEEDFSTQQLSKYCIKKREELKDGTLLLPLPSIQFLDSASSMTIKGIFKMLVKMLRDVSKEEDKGNELIVTQKDGAEVIENKKNETYIQNVPFDKNFIDEFKELKELTRYKEDSSTSTDYK